MKKVSQSISNRFCPQCLYMYGTYKADGKANFGLFTWATYCADQGFRFVACIGEDKLTRDRIRATGRFSASVVSEKLLSGADFCGNNSGYKVDKSEYIESVRGELLDVPIPVLSPWSYELEVDKTLRLDDRGDSEIYICKIRNVLCDEELADSSLKFGELLKIAAPVVSVCNSYFRLDPNSLGNWGDWKDGLSKIK